MSKKLRIVMAQLNFLVGDIKGNLTKHIEAAKTARDKLHADVIVFPELSLTGYLPEDFLLRQDFLDASDDALNEFKKQIKNIYCLVGHPLRDSKKLYNACSLIYNGKVLANTLKHCLPNFGVFDERRYFKVGKFSNVADIHGISVGMMICADVWYKKPMAHAVKQGARLILVPNASPFETTKDQERQRLLTKQAASNQVAIIYVNQVGGQDEVIFDGGSMAVDTHGKICQHANFFTEELIPVDLDVSDKKIEIANTYFTPPSEEEMIYQALVLSLRDYVQKNNFPGVLLGVSGGIDSALVLAIAVDALGKDKVNAIIMPSRYTADASLEYGNALIKNLGVHTETISIEPSFSSFLTTLAPVFGNKKPDVTEENIQSRCRGVILMALSNKTGNLVLCCGNRSEFAVGYTTLYGDTVGGFAVLKDVPKTLVYRLAKYRNTIAAVIPEQILERAPTAELSPNQKDEDSLPPYSILDKILYLYLNKKYSKEQIIARGFESTTVEKVIQLINRNEYKRKQSPLGARINHTAFGRDRRCPVTSGFKK